MKKVSCEVIRDLLPLYVDDAANQETRELVQEHLNTCPYCRDELRMMRSLVTLPPDEDTELMLQTFRERQARRRRNKKIAIISTVSAAALIVLLFLWYVRPRSWPSLVGLDEVNAISADAMELYFKYSDGEEAPDADWHFWKLDAEGETVPAQQLLSALDDVVLLPKVSNLRNYTPFPRTHYIVTGAGSHLSLYLFTHDHQDFFFVVFYNNGLVTIRDTRGSCFVYDTRENPYEALTSIVQQYGTLQED